MVRLGRSAVAHAVALPNYMEPLLRDHVEAATAALAAQGLDALADSKGHESDDDGGVVEVRTRGSLSQVGVWGRKEADVGAVCLCGFGVEQNEEEIKAVYGNLNRDLCEKCHNRGSLVCCDFCSAAYHEQCIPFSVPRPDLESDDPWRSVAATPSFMGIVRRRKSVIHEWGPSLWLCRCPACFAKEDKGVEEEKGEGQESSAAQAAPDASRSVGCLPSTFLSRQVESSRTPKHLPKRQVGTEWN